MSVNVYRQAVSIDHLAEAVRRELKERKWSQRFLAQEHIGCTQADISFLVTKKSLPGQGTIRGFVETLELSFEDLYGDLKITEEEKQVSDLDDDLEICFGMEIPEEHLPEWAIPLLFKEREMRYVLDTTIPDKPEILFMYPPPEDNFDLQRVLFFICQVAGVAVSFFVGEENEPDWTLLEED